MSFAPHYTIELMALTKQKQALKRRIRADGSEADWEELSVVRARIAAARHEMRSLEKVWLGTISHHLTPRAPRSAARAASSNANLPSCGDNMTEEDVLRERRRRGKIVFQKRTSAYLKKRFQEA